MLQVLQQNKSFPDYLFFKELYFLPATSATSYRVGQKTHLEQVEQQETVISEKALFLESTIFTCSTCFTKRKAPKNTLGADVAAKKGCFQKSAFLREHCIYLPQLPQRPKCVRSSGHILGK
ncbi:hypothetical protein [Ruminococcus sp.]|uniref:hypothetical protein n=1 Tax=Ruminococcus sp. TaxID=41978 RepID=UPI003867ED55